MKVCFKGRKYLEYVCRTKSSLLSLELGCSHFLYSDTGFADAIRCTILFHCRQVFLLEINKALVEAFNLCLDHVAGHSVGGVSSARVHESLTSVHCFLLKY